MVSLEIKDVVNGTAERQTTFLQTCDLKTFKAD